MMLLRRLPPFYDVLPVFAVITTIFLWLDNGYLSLEIAWMVIFITTGEIARIFAYQMTTNLIESLCVISLPLLLCMTLPSGVIKIVFESVCMSWIIIWRQDVLVDVWNGIDCDRGGRAFHADTINPRTNILDCRSVNCIPAGLLPLSILLIIFILIHSRL